MLIKKLFRTLWQYKAQFISMVIMVALGVGVFLGFNVEWYTLAVNTKEIYDATGFADFRIYSDKGFGPEDLEWNGVRFTALQPETLPGAPETELIDNEDGTWLLRCDGDGYEAVFLCGEGGSDPRILSYSILDEDAEGPRCVRLGDLFSDDYCRFRSEGNEPDDSMTELLYGQAGTAPWGQAAYDYAGGEVSLRYVTEADGREVELLLRYVQNRLAEIIIHTL